VSPSWNADVLTVNAMALPPLKPCAPSGLHSSMALEELNRPLLLGGRS
jgi:hypothetical protein